MSTSKNVSVYRTKAVIEAEKLAPEGVGAGKLLQTMISRYSEMLSHTFSLTCENPSMRTGLQLLHEIWIQDGAEQFGDRELVAIIETLESMAEKATNLSDEDRQCISRLLSFFAHSAEKEERGTSPWDLRPFLTSMIESYPQLVARNFPGESA